MSCQGTSWAYSIIIQAVADVLNLKIILIIESHELRSFRLRVVSPTPCSPTSSVDSPTFSMLVRLQLNNYCIKRGNRVIRK